MKNSHKCANFFVGTTALVVMLVVPACADAATIGLRTDAQTYPVTTYQDNQNTSTDTVAAGQTSATQTSTVSNSGNSAGATATAQADIVTGELKASILTSYTSSSTLGEDSTSGFGEVWVSESFNVVGSGYAHAFFSVDGSYDLARLGSGSVGFQELARISMYAGAFTADPYHGYSPLATSPAGIAESTVCPTGCSSVSGPIDDLLSFDVYLDQSYYPQYTFQAYMLAQITLGAGSIDLSHTGKLLILTDDGLQLNPLDENFLSNPVYNVSATPLPATLPIFASGLGGLGLLGLWRKKRKTT